MVTSIWYLVFYKFDGNDNKCNKSSQSNNERAFWKSDFRNVCSFIELFVSIFIYTVVFCRFALPLENYTHMQLLGMLQESLVNGSDSVEFFGYMDEKKITQDFGVVYAILCRLHFRFYQ